MYLEHHEKKKKDTNTNTEPKLSPDFKAGVRTEDDMVLERVMYYLESDIELGIDDERREYPNKCKYKYKHKHNIYTEPTNTQSINFLNSEYYDNDEAGYSS